MRDKISCWNPVRLETSEKAKGSSLSHIISHTVISLSVNWIHSASAQPDAEQHSFNTARTDEIVTRLFID